MARRSTTAPGPARSPAHDTIAEPTAPDQHAPARPRQRAPQGVPPRAGAAPDAESLPITGAALLYAHSLHEGQRRRSDGAPFIVHPIEVAALLRGAGAGDRLVAAGILHDTIEKTDASASALRRRFGAKVTALVLAVTDDPAISGYVRRKAALRAQVAGAGEEALMLFAADKVSRAVELRAARSTPPRRRLAHYRSSLQVLEERLPGCELTERLRKELARLPGGANKRAR
jgi:hypothetical protein